MSLYLGREGQPQSTTRYSRRFFLSTLLYAGLAAGCQPTADCPKPDRAKYPLGTAAPDSFRQEVFESLNPFRPLLTPKMQDMPLDIVIANEYNGDPGMFNRNANGKVKLEVIDFSGNSLRLAKLIYWHEYMHVFDIGNNQDPNKTILKWVQDKIGDTVYESPATTRNLLQPVTESTYETDPCAGKLGHPESHNSELFASTATIMRLYPQELRSKLVAHTELGRKKKLIHICLGLVESLVQFSATPIAHNDLPFDPLLLTYLQDNA